MRFFRGAAVSSRPLVGVATQSLEAIPGKLPNCWVMGQRYVRVLASLGAVPVLIPLLLGDEETLRLTYERLDAVFLTGGSTRLAHVRAAILAMAPEARVVDGDTFGSVGTGLTIEAARRYGPLAA